MSRLLFTVWPFPTHLNPFIALALEARKRGHEIAFYTGGEGATQVSQQGFRCFPFRNVDWTQVARIVEDLIAGRHRPSQMRRLWPRFLVETVPAQVQDLETIRAFWAAEALVCDIAMWAPILILHERERVPVIAFSHLAYCILPGPEGPIPGIALPRHRHRRTVFYTASLRLLAKWVSAPTHRQVNKLRRQFGLPQLPGGVNEFTGTLPLYLVPGVPQFDNYRKDLPPAVRYVGPCLWDKPPSQESPDWLGKIPRSRPCVLVEEGALSTAEPRILKMAVRALAGLPLTVILMAGEGRELSSLSLLPLPENMILKPRAPLSDTLPRANAFVTNGDSESVLAALRMGLPIVVLPSTWYQAELAWRIQETGVGLRLSPRHASPERMRSAVERVLKEPSFQENAVAMGAALEHQGGSRRAIELVESTLACAHRTPDPKPLYWKRTLA
jgi:UDP:flavonoid glycosyltransferase YjiC (YdhE family)